MSSDHEHHEEAERLLRDARTEQDSVRRSLILAEAQVHATLAFSAPAGEGRPGPGQDRAADTKSTGETRPARPAGQPDSLSPGTLTPAPPGEPESEPYPRVRGDRPPPDNEAVRKEAVRKVAPAAPAGSVRTGNPSQPVPGPVPGQPGPGGPGKEKPGDPGDQKPRGPAEPKPGGFTF
jgi:hypothetical protein